MRVFGRDLIRGGHYGQRSCEPQLKAEHMAAPTNPAKSEESSCQHGAVHTWHGDYDYADWTTIETKLTQRKKRKPKKVSKQLSP
jgi:hypothetical protein